MNNMAFGNNYVGTIIKRSILIIILSAALSYFFFNDGKAIAYGIVFGGSIAVLGFKLMAASITSSARMIESSAKKHVVINYIIRYIIYGVVLAIAAKADYINLFSTVISMFVVKFVIITETLFSFVKKREN